MLTPVFCKMEQCVINFEKFLNQRVFTYRSPGEGEVPGSDIIGFDAQSGHGWSNSSTIEEQCALEIFFLFMLSTCMWVESVKSQTKPTEDDTMNNSMFTALAHQVVESSLTVANSFHKALLCIIPAFAKFGRLPQVSTAENNLVQEDASL
jgi:hypothetical protein